MKKQGKDVTPEDYKKLQEEIAILKKDLAQERLRADFLWRKWSYSEKKFMAST